MTISRKLQQQMVDGGWIRRMFEEGIALKKKYGERNVFDLSLGNPVIEPPGELHRELRRWVDSPSLGHNQNGFHRDLPSSEHHIGLYGGEAVGGNFSEKRLEPILSIWQSTLHGKEQWSG